MYARVLEVSNNQIYLEIDNQLRFRCSWIIRPLTPNPSVTDRVEFHFGQRSGKPTVVIEQVKSNDIPVHQ